MFTRRRQFFSSFSLSLLYLQQYDAVFRFVFTSHNVRAHHTNKHAMTTNVIISVLSANCVYWISDYCQCHFVDSITFINVIKFGFIVVVFRIPVYLTKIGKHLKHSWALCDLPSNGHIWKMCSRKIVIDSYVRISGTFWNDFRDFVCHRASVSFLCALFKSHCHELIQV